MLMLSSSSLLILVSLHFFFLFSPLRDVCITSCSCLPALGQKRGGRKESVLPWDGERREAPKKGERRSSCSIKKHTCCLHTRDPHVCSLIPHWQRREGGPLMTPPPFPFCPSPSPPTLGFLLPPFLSKTHLLHANIFGEGLLLLCVQTVGVHSTQQSARSNMDFVPPYVQLFIPFSWRCSLAFEESLYSSISLPHVRRQLFMLSLGLVSCHNKPSFVSNASDCTAPVSLNSTHRGGSLVRMIHRWPSGAGDSS